MGDVLGAGLDCARGELGVCTEAAPDAVRTGARPAYDTLVDAVLPTTRCMFKFPISTRRILREGGT